MTRMTRLYQLLVALMVALFLLAPQLTQAKNLVLHDINYWAAAGDAACASPPANFDPMSASANQLSYFGLLRRPLGSTKVVAYWADRLPHAKKRVCGNSVPGNSYHTLADQLRGML